MLRSWGLLLAAVVLGLLIALLGYDRPSPVGIGDPAAATGPGADAADSPGSSDAAVGVAPGTDAAGAGGSGTAAGSAGAVVHVVGDVARPGVFTLPVGARVADAVAAAGGAVPGADLSGVNLARRVNDGEQIVVGVAAQPPSPTGASPPGASAPTSGDAGPGLVDLNRASSDDLQQLPRVGPVTAEKIIAHREQHGPFTSVEQLLEVPGIGEGTLSGLRDLVTV